MEPVHDVDSGHGHTDDGVARQILGRVAGGDATALDELKDHFEQKLLEFAVRKTGDYRLAEQAVEETFVAAALQADRFQGRSRVQTWLFGIASHKCADRSRRKDMECIDESDLCEADRLRWAAESVSSPEDLTLARAGRDELLRAIRQTLTPMYEEVLMLWATGHRYDEIAQIAGIPIGTVKSRLSYARQAMASSLGHRSETNG